MIFATTIFKWSVAWDYRTELLNGLAVAMEVASLSLLISIIVSLLIALSRMSRTPLKWLAALYVNIFRGIPPLVSVLWVYFGLSLLVGVNMTPFQAGVVTLVLLYSAFIAEIYRAALEAIPKGQREAAVALGLSRFRSFWHVTLPQATKIAIPNVGSMFIGMVKDTSVISVIGLLEVIHVTENIESVTFQPFVLYTVAAGFYVIVAFVLDFVFRVTERTLAKPASGVVTRFITSRSDRRIAALIGAEAE